MKRSCLGRVSSFSSWSAGADPCAGRRRGWMTTAFFTHPACLEHDTGPGHPERPQRLEAVLLALDEPEFNLLERREAPLAELSHIARVHDKSYAEELLSRVPQRGWGALGG